MYNTLFIDSEQRCNVVGEVPNRGLIALKP